MQTLKSKQSHKNGLNGGKSMPATNLEQQEAIVPEKIYVSVVIPIYNEAENLPLLFTQMQQALDNLTQPGEVILVDDVVSTGSTLKGMETIVSKAGGSVVNIASVFTEGDADWSHVLALGNLPVFTNSQ